MDLVYLMNNMRNDRDRVTKSLMNVRRLLGIEHHGIQRQSPSSVGERARAGFRNLRSRLSQAAMGYPYRTELLSLEA